MRGHGKAWIFVLVAVVLVCMMDSSAASQSKPRETEPTYNIERTAKGYKTSFRKNGRIFYSVKTAKKPVVKFVSTRKLTATMLGYRRQKSIIYVEIDNGTVINRKKEGIDEMGYYVSYKKVKGARKGSKVLSYFIYDPNNNFMDAIEGRCDYLVRK